MASAGIAEDVLLDTEMRSAEVVEFERRLRARVVGQDRAVRRVVNMYQIFMAGMANPTRPIGNLLFLGPTGSGKTRIVEASAEILFGSPRAFIKIDCAEFQHSHEIAKLIGSPPGVDRLMGGDGVDPGAKHPAGLEPVRLAVHLEKRGLEHVGRQVAVVEVAAQIAVQFVLVAMHEGLEGGLVVLRGKPLEELLVGGLGRGGRSLGNAGLHDVVSKAFGSGIRNE